MSKLKQTLIVLAVIFLYTSETITEFVADYLWFSHLGYESIFLKQFNYKFITGFAVFILCFLCLWINKKISLKLTEKQSFINLNSGGPLRKGAYLMNSIFILAIFIVSFLSGLFVSNAWENVALYVSSADIGIKDPIFEKDLQFYFFKLPILKLIINFLIFLVILSFIQSLLIYFFKGIIGVVFSLGSILSTKVKVHFSALIILFGIFLSFKFEIQRYDVLYSSHSIFFGGGYSDVNAKIISYWIMAALSFVLPYIFTYFWIRDSIKKHFSISIFASIFFVSFFLLLGVIPRLVQKIIVEPNELAKELPYIKHSIKYTNQAYGLDKVEKKVYTADQTLSAKDISSKSNILENIRLWDWKPLLSTFKQIQEIRLYYNFNGVDIDRYKIDGKTKQVMISTRELAYEQVPEQAKTWVNQRLKYTHGYGVVVSSVNEVTEQGLPKLFVKNIPPKSTIKELEIKRPEIYYGEQTDNYIFTGTKTDEFDYPLDNKNQMTRYSGSGGVDIGSFWKKILYAYYFKSLKILISEYLDGNSKVHYSRNITTRVRKIFPYLSYDPDPYMTILDGKLFWIIDAYTTTDKYPYSQPFSRKGDNYIRNSVKVLVDAYNGSVDFYIVDEDPIVKSYKEIFPNFFKEKKDLSQDIISHFRYPSTLFEIQSKIYLTYHMQDPTLFYNREDLWKFPSELYSNNQIQMDPYYVIMNLPGSEKEEFLLVLPFTPQNKNNMIAWMAARSDDENYGKLILYEFPKKELFYGPMQIEARIDQDSEISQQLTLWNQQGSNVIRGNLLVLPIKNSLVYVEPLYIRSEKGQMPELKRIIVAYKNKIVMKNTLKESFEEIFGNTIFNESSLEVTSEELPQNFFQLSSMALDKFVQAREELKKGEFAKYGSLQKELEEILTELKAQAEEK